MGDQNLLCITRRLTGHKDLTSHKDLARLTELKIKQTLFFTKDDDDSANQAADRRR